MRGHRARSKRIVARSIAIAVLLGVVAAAAWYVLQRRGGAADAEPSYVDGRLINQRLRELPANTWVEIASERPGWTRQGHAGIAFDSRRGTLLIFGSDTHGENWDNTIHEFSPLTLRWTTHYGESPPKTYRVDANGTAVAGERGEAPWAMHSYDNLVYSARLDALVLTSRPDHTPTQGRQLSRDQPTWIYRLETRQWEAVLGALGARPSFFAAGSAYDPNSGEVAAYQHGALWWLDPAGRSWRRAPGNHQTDLGLHFMMLTDSARNQLVLFGSPSGAVWVYPLPASPDQESRWEARKPGGDGCRRDESFPVAYDLHQRVFLLLPDEDAQSSVTTVYLPQENVCLRVPGATLPAQKMNYMMEYDSHHRVFLLVTGDWRSPVTVWAFRLDLAALSRP